MIRVWAKNQAGEGRNMRQLILRAMHQSDDLVVTFDYCDAKGVTASFPTGDSRRTRVSYYGVLL